MDLDAYVLTHSADWRRLDELAGRRSLSGAESDELVELYQRVATHLSVVRTSAPDAGLIAHLSSVLARARQRTVGTRATTWRGVRDFFTQRFPAALYRLRWWWLGTLAANVVVIGVMMWWLLGNPSVEQSLLTPDEVDQLVRNDFEGYYSEYAASHFAAQVWINNAWVAALCIALGILGAPVIWLLFQNIANLAIIGSIMTRHDHAGHFWGLILPHGLLELTAVFVAGGVGLRLFWSWIEPGPLTRAPVAGPRGPHGGDGRPRAGGGAGPQRGHRGVRDPVRRCPPGRGWASGSSPSSPSSPTSSCSGATPSCAGTPGTSTPRCWRTGSPPRPDRAPQSRPRALRAR